MIVIVIVGSGSSCFSSSGSIGGSSCSCGDQWW